MNKKETHNYSKDVNMLELGNLLIQYSVSITKYPAREEAGHGQHWFNEDTVEIEITKVLDENDNDILKDLDKDTIEYLKDKIEY